MLVFADRTCQIAKARKRRTGTTMATMAHEPAAIVDAVTAEMDTPLH
jgi:hypothetical protein